MQITKNTLGIVRILIGIIVASHGMLRILFLNIYIEFVVSHFYEVIPHEATLTICFSILPFLELFMGLLIIFKIELKRFVFLGLSLSLLVSILLIYKHLYLELLYYTPLVAWLTWLYYNYLMGKNRTHLFYYSKGKVYTRGRRHFRF